MQEEERKQKEKKQKEADEKAKSRGWRGIGKGNETKRRKDRRKGELQTEGK